MQHGEAATRGSWNAAPIAAPDHAGVNTAFDQYAQVLLAYCQSRLGEPAEAAEAVQDTFIVASAKAARLSQPGRLRAWLFAVARNECHRRLGAGVRSAPLYEAAEAMDDTGTLSAITEQAELRALVRAALARLDPLDREISELNLRYGLLGADLGAVLGVPASQAPVLAARASSRFQQSLGVLRVGRSGREYCSDLAAAMDAWRAMPTVLLRWRVKRHVERCAVCADLKRRDVNPAMLLSMLTVPVLPPGLRERVLHLVAEDAPDAAGYRAEVIERAEPFGPDGFPVQLAAPSASRWLGTSVIAASVAVGALALLGGGMYYVDYTSTHSAAHTQSAAIVASARPSNSPSPSHKPSPSHSPSPSPSPTPPPVVVQPAAPSPSPSPSRKPSPSHSPSPSKSASPSPPKSASPSPSLSPSPSNSGSPSPSHSTSPSPVVTLSLTPPIP